MRLKNVIASAALATAVVAAPIQASAETVVARTSAAVEGEDQARGAGRYVIAFLAILAVGLGLYFALDDDNATSP